MEITKTPLDGLVLINPKKYHDERGFFLETYQMNRYAEAGITDTFVQDNHSHSNKGILRGLHFQKKFPQAQIVTVMRGHIFDVAVDLRPNSPTFGKWYGAELRESGVSQIYMAPGFAHGFYVLSDSTDMHYKVSRIYNHSDEGGLIWNDSDVAIKWPDQNPQVSERDLSFPTLKELVKTYPNI